MYSQRKYERFPFLFHIFFNFTLRICLRFFDHIIKHIDLAKEEAIKIGVNVSKKIVVIPHGVLDYYKSVPRDNSIVTKVNAKNLILFFGSILYCKGLDILLKSFGKLPKRVLDKTQLLIAGYPYIPIKPLKDIVKKLRLEERVIWELGYIDGRKITPIFERADVVVLPYRNIEQSGVLMLAIAFRKYIIASSINGLKEVLKDYPLSTLVEPENILMLRKALEDALSDENSLNVKKHLTYKEIDNLIATKYSWDKIAEKTIQVYQKSLFKR